ncbi:hypothetical protein Syun_006077 [Stephania yunnanensis]|uniref:Uncharacterized protein n=1 Tax=Stephania yunnanensis TaxID=152371 RepID=A0AAP0KW95_9MAGN
MDWVIAEHSNLTSAFALMNVDDLHQHSQERSRLAFTFHENVVMSTRVSPG